MLSCHSLCWRVSTGRILHRRFGCLCNSLPSSSQSVASWTDPHFRKLCLINIQSTPWKSPIELEIHNTVWPDTIRVGQRCILASFSTYTISADKDITFCWKYALYCNQYSIHCYHSIALFEIGVSNGNFLGAMGWDVFFSREPLASMDFQCFCYPDHHH